MKRTLIFMIFIFFVLNLMQNITFASNSNLVKDVNVKYNYNLNGTGTSRLIVSFNLAENFDFSAENSNIIIEYYVKNRNGEFIPFKSSTTGQVYLKDKMWAGYLNSYNSEGIEYKYSKGIANDEKYLNQITSNTVLSTQITSDTKVDVDWTNESIFGIKVTVIRSDKSGEAVTAYSNGMNRIVEKIHAPIAPVVEVSVNTGIKLESVAELPASTQLVAERIENETVYTNISNALPEAKDIVIYNIKLQSSGVNIQPNGNVRISIPIPHNFDNSKVKVYRFAEDGSQSLYDIGIESKDGVDYATFETEHFSTYVLAEISNIINSDTNINITNIEEQYVTPSIEKIEKIYPYNSILQLITKLIKVTIKILSISI